MRSRQLIALTTLLAAALIAIVAVALAARHKSSDGFDGSLLPRRRARSRFDLRDQDGRPLISPSSVAAR